MTDWADLFRLFCFYSPRNYPPNVYKTAYFVNVVNACTQSYKGDKHNTIASCQRCTRLYTNLETQRVIHMYLYYIYIFS